MLRDLVPPMSRLARAAPQHVRTVCDNRAVGAGARRALRVGLRADWSVVGVVAGEELPSGAFVVELAGQVISNEERVARMRSRHNHAQLR